MPATGEDLYRPDLVSANAGRLVTLSGCSGGGKSSLLAELGRRGFATYAEPGRQVVKEQRCVGGTALPWDDIDSFVELTISRSIHNMTRAAGEDCLSFFDRGIIDQISGLEHLKRPVPAHLAAAAQRFRSRDTVFMMPPWREIFRNDGERRHGFDAAADNYATLLQTYRRYGYRPVPVPKLDVAARADFVMAELELAPSGIA